MYLINHRSGVTIYYRSQDVGHDMRRSSECLSSEWSNSEYCSALYGRLNLWFLSGCNHCNDCNLPCNVHQGLWFEQSCDKLQVGLLC